MTCEQPRCRRKAREEFTLIISGGLKLRASLCVRCADTAEAWVAETVRRTQASEYLEDAHMG